MNSKEWSEKIIYKFDPIFKHRWEIYDSELANLIMDRKIWIDCGCGDNDAIIEKRENTKIALGIDLINHNKKDNFIQADIKKLPLKKDSIDLITLRFVVEHFESANEYLYEINRITKQGGKVLILTTNLISPIIFIPKILLPNKLKSKILIKLFKVKDDDVFPAYHKLNTPKSFHKLINDFKLQKMIFISDLNYTRKWIFFLLLIWHLITQPKFLNKFKSNLLVILEKK